MSDESEQNFDVDISTHTVAVSTETPFCLNGGTLVNGKCHCQIQYSGFRCQRLIRGKGFETLLSLLLSFTILIAGCLPVRPSFILWLQYLE